jgi:hypothetical protein
LPQSKQNSNLVALLLIVIAVLILLQSGAISWRQPTPIELALGTCITNADGQLICYPAPTYTSALTTTQASTGTVHVADTWQRWTFYLNDGSSYQKSSNIVGLGVQFALVDLSTIRAIKIEVPVVLATELSCQNFNPITPTCLNYEFVVVRPSATATLNGQSYSVQANWWALSTFTYGQNHAGDTITYDFWVLLSGAMQSSSDRTLDLRQQVRNLGLSSFTFGTVISEDWSAYVSRSSMPVLTDHKIVPVAYEAQFGIDLNQMSGTFTVPMPPQTVRTCSEGICVDIPATTFTTSASGITATVSGNGTTFTLKTTITDTLKLPGLPDFCSWIPWLCGSTWGLPNWAWVLLAIVLLWLLLRRNQSSSVTIVAR